MPEQLLCFIILKLQDVSWNIYGRREREREKVTNISSIRIYKSYFLNNYNLRLPKITLHAITLKIN